MAGNKLFGVDIAAIVDKAMSASLLPATLTHITPGTRGADSTAGTQPTETTHAARGIVDEYSRGEIASTSDRTDGTMIVFGDKKILLIGDSISPTAEPESGDRIEIEGSTYSIIHVGRDPAKATYVCQSRRPSS